MKDSPNKHNRFYNALRGYLIGLKEEQNLQIHTAAVVLVILMSLFLHISFTHMAILVLVFGLVIGMELINTCIEDICNFIRDGQKLSWEATRNIRDIAAAAVAVQALVAVVVGLLIFSQYIF